MTLQLSELTWPEVQAQVASGTTRAVFACGATEQHGPHLPLAVDSLIGDALAETVARKLGRALAAPTVKVGCSRHHMSFPGTLTLSEETFKDVVEQQCRSLAHHGFAEICVIPSHGGNFRPVAELIVAMRGSMAPGVRVVAYTDLVDYVETWREIIARAGGPADHVGGHADIAEASMILALQPGLVRRDLAAAGYRGDLEAVLPTIWQEGFSAVTENGVLGDPDGMSAGLGHALIDGVSTRIARHFETELARSAGEQVP
jgi:creatinine amidohydrolase